MDPKTFVSTLINTEEGETMPAGGPESVEKRQSFFEPPKKPVTVIYGLLVDNVILIDVVGSHSDCKREGNPRVSIPAPDTPYDLLAEPKSGNAFDSGMIKRHGLVKDQILQALQTLYDNHRGKYCWKRNIADREDAAIKDDGIPKQMRNFKVICEPLKMGLAFTSNIMGGIFWPWVLEDQISIQGRSLAEMYGNVVMNSNADWKSIGLTDVIHNDVVKFDIPPRCSFLVGPFSESFDMFNHYCSACTHSGFDLIVMDPPWPNRSASRSKSYDSFNPNDLLKLRRGTHLKHDGLLAVWVTNNTKHVDFVLNKLFPSMGLVLEAKWIWVKVTTGGDPVFDLEAISRKPYEMLLFGRLAGAFPPKEWTPQCQLPLTDKVLVGVPEIHSRKPCLRELIAPYIPIYNKAAVCEIFARNLVRGWFSWGDEVLMGNWVE